MGSRRKKLAVIAWGRDRNVCNAADRASLVDDTCSLVIRANRYIGMHSAARLLRTIASMGRPCSAHTPVSTAQSPDNASLQFPGDD